MAIRKFSTASIKSGVKSSKFWDQTTTLSGTFDLIETASVTSDVSSVTFSNLGNYAGSYKHLRIIGHSIDSRTSNNTWIRIRFNSDTGSNYLYSNIRFNDGNTAGTTISADNQTELALVTTRDNPSGGDTLYGVAFTANISDYSSTSKYTTIQSWGGQYQSNGWTNNHWSGIWKSTAAVTSITLFPDSGVNFKNNSKFHLFGLKG